MNRGGGRGGNRGGRGRSPRSTGRYVVRQSPAGAHSTLAHGSGSSEIGRGNPETPLVDGVTKGFSEISTSDYPCGPNSDPHRVSNVSRDVGNSEQVQNVPKAKDQTPTPWDSLSVVHPGRDNDFPSLSAHSELNARNIHVIQSRDEEEQTRTPSYSSPTAPDVIHKKKEPSQTVDSGFRGGQFSQEVQSGKNVSERAGGTGEHQNSDSQHKEFSFDICEETNRNVVKLKSSLLDKNRALRAKRRVQGNNKQNLRPGMVLIKGYLSLPDQVKLIKLCRDLGRGPGGFYQPGYRDGATLHLKMMCLGKDWDPETGKYRAIRPIDEARPPPIPDEFLQIVKGALQESHDYLDSHSKVRNALPSMSPNICIVNYYSKTGKLGLHQDKDESQESLRKGLPVVSFSIGDSADFLFGDQRDIDKAKKVVLESGDVLIFGGESRHIFHGVSAIHPGTAAEALLEETNLKPGRLNLTFREY